MPISPNKRIFLNIVTTYGRCLLGTICGLFTGRWALMALGEVDFGLFGLVGGLAGFIGLLNSVLATATGRFYAFSVGQAKNKGEEGLELCRQWFNTALLLHTVIPLILIVIGYPIGLYAVKNWLTIPPDRVNDCIWVFRFSCISCFFSMVTVPYNAMYYAKQYIAELTIYTTATLIINVIALYYMVTHPGKWLTGYAFCFCISAVLPTIIIAIRSVKLFPECRFNRNYLWSRERIKELITFSGWHAFGGTGGLISGYGNAVLINKYFGPAVNAAGTISTQLSGQTNTLSGSIINAFSPAITNACGERDYEKMQKMSFFACKYATLMILVFAIPLSLELSEVLRIWLKNPPQYMAGLCLCGLLSLVIGNLSCGYMLAINATGKIAAYQAFCGTMIMMAFPFAWLFIVLDWGVYSIGYGGFLSAFLLTIGRVWLARKKTKMSAKKWIYEVVIPLAILTVCCTIFGVLPRLCLPQSFLRICITTVICEAVIFSATYLFLMKTEERLFINTKIKTLKEKFL